MFAGLFFFFFFYQTSLNQPSPHPRLPRGRFVLPFSSILIPVISLVLISLIFQIVHLLIGILLIPSQNNGGSSSCDSFSLTVHGGGGPARC